MSGQDQFDRIAAALNEAVLDDALWPRAMELIGEACGMASSHLAIADDSSGAPDFLFGLLCNNIELPSEEVEREYVRDYFPIAASCTTRSCTLNGNGKRPPPRGTTSCSATMPRTSWPCAWTARTACTLSM